jgi:hypothetical protein
MCAVRRPLLGRPIPELGESGSWFLTKGREGVRGARGNGAAIWGPAARRPRCWLLAHHWLLDLLCCYS